MRLKEESEIQSSGLSNSVSFSTSLFISISFSLLSFPLFFVHTIIDSGRFTALLSFLLESPFITQKLQKAFLRSLQWGIGTPT